MEESTKFLNSKNSNSIVGIKIVPRDPDLIENDVKLVGESSVDLELKGGTNKVQEFERELLNGTKREDGRTVKNHTKSSLQRVNRTGWRRYLGIVFGILASVIFSLGVLIVKYLKDYTPSSVAIWRFQGILIPSAFLLIYSALGERKEKNRDKKKIFDPILPLCQSDKLKISLFLFLRAFTGCTAVIFQYYSLKYMSMADSTVIVFSTPVFVTFFAYCVLKEKFGLVNVFCAVITLLGLVVITRPPFLTGAEKMDMTLLIGVLLASASMTFGSWVFLTLRMLKGVNHSVVGFFFGLYGTIESAILAAIIGTFELPESGNWLHWSLAIFVAVITFFGQLCMTLALKYEEAGVVALTRCLDVVFSFVWQFIFLGVLPDLYSLLGSSIVMFGVILVFFRKHLSMLPEDHPRRQRFCLILK